VKASQKDVGRNRPAFQDTQEMFCLGLDQPQWTDRIKRFLLHGAFIADACFVGLEFHALVHYILQVRCATNRVGRGQVGARQLEIQMRLPVRLDSCAEQFDGLGFAHLCRGWSVFRIANRGGNKCPPYDDRDGIVAS